MIGNGEQENGIIPNIDSVGKGYALWLMPKEPMFSLLAGKISRLSHEYSTPRFDPHLTLLSEITGQEQEIRAKSGALASSFTPIKAELGGIGYLDEYFRCLFIKVVPTSAFIKANQAAQEAFEMRNKQLYMPHLSLVYGRMRLETKKKIAAEFGSLSGQTLEWNQVKLYSVVGPLDDWKCIETYDLR